jgi:hypothetical protein
MLRRLFGHGFTLLAPAFFGLRRWRMPQSSAHRLKEEYEKTLLQEAPQLCAWLTTIAE